MNPEDTQKIILELDERWNNAYRTKNLSELKAVLAEDWIGFRPEVVLNKNLLIAGLQTNPEATLEFTRFEICIFGETAITRGHLRAITTTETRAQSFMRVYAKRSGQWQAVAVQVVPEVDQ